MVSVSVCVCVCVFKCILCVSGHLEEKRKGEIRAVSCV